MLVDPFNALTLMNTSHGKFSIFSLEKMTRAEGLDLERLPFSIRVLLEGLMRHTDGQIVTREDVLALANWKARSAERRSLAFYPGRVLMQDFSGVPVLNDLAAMRSAFKRMGGDPEKINPRIPVDVVVDHSSQIDFSGTADAFDKNLALEYSRNYERYEFLRWSQQAFDRLRIIPPASGIIHQVNLEHLAQGILFEERGELKLAGADTLVGTDSHTTMINGLGVLGWGVGGIEAVAAMLGEPLEFVTPDVVGVRLRGELPEGATPTDLTLSITQLLRKVGVVDKFVEFFGDGAARLQVADRAMIANMAPEYGATAGYFPVDTHTLDYIRLTRGEEQAQLIDTVYHAQGLFREQGCPDPEYSAVVEIDLRMIEPSLAGPKRPQDRLALRQVQAEFQKALRAPRQERGFGLGEDEVSQRVKLQINGQDLELEHGSVVLAAITSCTNTSNPTVMLAAGLLAKKAVEKGLRVQAHVKTSLAPGSRVVTEYLRAAGLMPYLEALGFHLSSYGCTTCIGNSGPLKPEVEEALAKQALKVCAVISGNRNFEGRVHALVQGNYLASPPLVVAYALAGTVNIQMAQDPLGLGDQGQPVYLVDIFPTRDEIEGLMSRFIDDDLFTRVYGESGKEDSTWEKIIPTPGKLYRWKPESTYLQEPPFFEIEKNVGLPVADITGGRALVMLGDSITTDHISPAGSIPEKSPAGEYLMSEGVKGSDFNAYGTRRGNDRVMTRGTFANIRLKNLLAQGKEGGFTMHFPGRETMRIYEAAMQYKAEGIPLLVLAGKEYGTGSSRDWAAKGALLLGVRAVLAESYERIHRSNLAGMGVLPLQYVDGENAQSLGLTGEEEFSIIGIEEALKTGQPVQVKAIKEDGAPVRFAALVRLDTSRDVLYYRSGGVMNAVLYGLKREPS